MYIQMIRDAAIVEEASPMVAHVCLLHVVYCTVR
jgi:hypothetical protein